MPENCIPRYATWIRSRKIALFWVITAAILLVSIALSFIHPFLLAMGVLSLPFLYIALVISLTAFRFGEQGGDYQDKIHQILIDAVPREGEVLDIGCGSGRLINKIAKRNRGHHRGIDYWGDDWEYSRAQCEHNARCEGIVNVSFSQASASALPFRDRSIDHVVSCLTFHEVTDVEDKCASLAEAFRVLRAGGTFTFLDLFADESFYPERSKIPRTATEAGCTVTDFKQLSELLPLPYPLNTSKVLRHAMILTGGK